MADEDSAKAGAGGSSPEQIARAEQLRRSIAKLQAGERDVPRTPRELTDEAAAEARAAAAKPEASDRPKR
jgi:hypothetical protein